MADKTTRGERIAWDRYAAAAIAALGCLVESDYTRAARIADRMLCERRKRFPPRQPIQRLGQAR